MEAWKYKKKIKNKKNNLGEQNNFNVCNAKVQDERG